MHVAIAASIAFASVSMLLERLAGARVVSLLLERLAGARVVSLRLEVVSGVGVSPATLVLLYSH